MRKGLRSYYCHHRFLYFGGCGRRLGWWLHFLAEGDGAFAHSRSRSDADYRIRFSLPITESSSVPTPVCPHRLIGIHPGRNIRVHPPLQDLTLSGDNGGSHPVFGVNTQIAEGMV